MGTLSGFDRIVCPDNILIWLGTGRRTVIFLMITSLKNERYSILHIAEVPSLLYNATISCVLQMVK